MTILLKFCKKCSKETEFVRNGSKSTRCKPCGANRSKIYLRTERICAVTICKNRAYKCGTYCKQCSYEFNLKKNYNITLEEYGWIAYKQNFCCALCDNLLDFTTRRGAVVDHCHNTGLVRGLLHGACNTAIGLFDEDPVRIDRAAAYIRRFQVSR